MSVIYILIPIAILLTAIGIYIFFWAVKTEQFDDLEKQGMSILFDESSSEQEKPKDNTKKEPEIVIAPSTNNETNKSSDNEK